MKKHATADAQHATRGLFLAGRVSGYPVRPRGWICIGGDQAEGHRCIHAGDDLALTAKRQSIVHQNIK